MYAIRAQNRFLVVYELKTGDLMSVYVDKNDTHLVCIQDTHTYMGFGMSNVISIIFVTTRQCCGVSEAQVFESVCVYTVRARLIFLLYLIVLHGISPRNCVIVWYHGRVV